MQIAISHDIGNVFKPGSPWYQDTTQYANAVQPGMWSDFKNNRYMVGGAPVTFASIWDFTRASTGTYSVLGGLATAASDVPRFEVDPVTGVGIGLLMETASTNLFTKSQELNDGAWFKAGATVSADAGVAPDGTTTADAFIPGVASGLHQYIRASADVSVTNGVTYSASVCIKAFGYTKARVAIYPVQFAGGSVDVDLTAGTISAITGTLTEARIIPLGNGWYRVSVSATANATGGSSVINVYCLDNSGTASFPGDGVSGILIWGNQAEQQPTMTSYIPTTTAAVTRAIDAGVSVGGKFGWYTALQGTTYSSSLPRDTVGNKRAIELNDGTGNTRISPFNTSGGQGGIEFVASVATYNQSTGTSIVPYQRQKQMQRSAAGSQRFSSNGFLASAGANPGHPVCTQMNLGNVAAGGQHINGTIEDVRWYPNVVTDSEMQRLTT